MLPANTPLYNHPLPEIETWLTDQGCQRDPENISQWTFTDPDWSAKLWLEVDSIVVRYLSADGGAVQRSFKYSLSRSDLEKVIFLGP